MSSDAKDPSGVHQNASGCNNKKTSQKRAAAKFFGTLELSQRQVAAVEMVLQGLSDAQIAAQLNADRSTIYRWRTSSRFLRELERQRKILAEQSAARLQSMITPALEILNRQLTGDDPKTALRAAAILLRVATPSRLARFASDQDQAHPPTSPADDVWNKIEAYIAAPMPGKPGAPKCAPWEEEPDDLDDEADDLDEEST